MEAETFRKLEPEGKVGAAKPLPAASRVDPLGMGNLLETGYRLAP